jgi:hypothetical protein
MRPSTLSGRRATSVLAGSIRGRRPDGLLCSHRSCKAADSTGATTVTLRNRLRSSLSIGPSPASRGGNQRTRRMRVRPARTHARRGEHAVANLCMDYRRRIVSTAPLYTKSNRPRDPVQAQNRIASRFEEVRAALPGDSWADQRQGDACCVPVVNISMNADTTQGGGFPSENGAGERRKGNTREGRCCPPDGPAPAPRRSVTEGLAALLAPRLAAKPADRPVSRGG